jgi:hypothetical protein
MRLTAQRVFDVTQLLATIINEKRPMPLKGAYRLARLHAKLKPEFDVIAGRRDAIITAYGCLREGDGVPQVPADQMADFQAKWGELAAEALEVDVQPILLAQLDLGDQVPGALTALELSSLGDLVVDDAAG